MGASSKGETSFVENENYLDSARAKWKSIRQYATLNPGRRPFAVAVGMGKRELQ